MASKQPDNMRIWSAVERTDPAFTKAFSRGGGFRGTATNATYLARRATEMFGPIGIGWGVEPVREEYVEGAHLSEDTRETIHKVLVKVWYVLDGERGEVQQFGQTTFIGKNKHGLTTDEEHAKKSLTDGMSKCLSLLGFAADIHLGRYDDNKYVAEVQAEYREKAEAEKRASAPKITPEQIETLSKLIQQTGTDELKFCRFFKVEGLIDLPAADYERALKMLEKKRDQQQEDAA